MSQKKPPPARNGDDDVLRHVVHFDLYRGRDLPVALRNQLDNILRVLLENLDRRPRHEPRHGLPDALVARDDGEDGEEGVLLHHRADLGDGGIVQDLRVRVVTRLAMGAVQVTEPVVSLQYARQLAVHGEVVISVGN